MNKTQTTHCYPKVGPFLRAIQYFPSILLHKHFSQELSGHGRSQGGLSHLHGAAEYPWPASTHFQVMYSIHTYTVTFPLRTHNKSDNTRKGYDLKPKHNSLSLSFNT